MKEGIQAVKLNWSDDRYKNVILRVSNDNKNLVYDNVNVNKTMWEKIKGSGTLAFNKIAGISYGATTSNFSKVQESAVKLAA